MSEKESCCIHPSGPGSALSVLGYVCGSESSSGTGKGLYHTASGFPQSEMGPIYMVVGSGIPITRDGTEAVSKMICLKSHRRELRVRIQTSASPVVSLPPVDG